MEQEKNLNSQDVLAKLDSTMEKHFRRLDQINVLGNDISFNLISVAALHLVVEREIECLDSDPETTQVKRYTRKEFINDLTDLGLEINDSMMLTIESLYEKKYIRVDFNGDYFAETTAMTLVENFNRMFPGMPGMNLVAFFIQTLDEILSERKDYEKAVSQFDQSLKSRGRALSFVFLKTEKKSNKQKEADRVKKMEEMKASRKASEKLKKIYSGKLAELRKNVLNDSVAPSVLTKRALSASAISVKEISPQKIKEAKEKKEQERLEAERIERERLALELAELKRAEEERLELERLEAERIEREKREAEQARLERERKEEERLEKERLAKEAFEAERKEQERLEAERLELERLEKERIEKELAIEAKIASFEQEMAPLCPICHTGKIVSDKTATGKEYFKCSNEGCRFISWSKPYSFVCPVCSNPYLIEMQLPGGELGLKCPRASCSYTQNSLFNPVQVAAPPPATPPQPKKRRLVRRRKR